MTYIDGKEDSRYSADEAEPGPHKAHANAGYHGIDEAVISVAIVMMHTLNHHLWLLLDHSDSSLQEGGKGVKKLSILAKYNRFSRYSSPSLIRPPVIWFP